MVVTSPVHGPVQSPGFAVSRVEKVEWLDCVIVESQWVFSLLGSDDLSVSVLLRMRNLYVRQYLALLRTLVVLNRLVLQIQQHVF